MMIGKNRNIKKLLTFIPENSEGVEIGVWKGETSKLFLKKTKLLHLVDPWSADVYKGDNENGNFDDYLNKYSRLVGSNKEKDFNNYYENVYENVKNRFSQCEVKIYRETSTSFFSHFKNKVDWIYIDGSHFYKDVLLDLQNSYNIIKKNGLLAGDDYWSVKPGVMKAVDKFATDYNLKLQIIGENQFLFKL